MAPPWPRYSLQCCGMLFALFLSALTRAARGRVAGDESARSRITANLQHGDGSQARMAHTFIAGVARTLRAAVLTLPLLTLSVADGGAGAWRWSHEGSRERLALQLDAPAGNVAISRTGTTTLVVYLPVRENSEEQPAGGTVPGAMLAEVAPCPAGLELRLNTAAFGYLATRPAPDRLVIDIYHDPLGARWRPSGRLAPPAPAAAMPPKNTGPEPGTPAPEASALPTSPPEREWAQSPSQDSRLPLKEADDSLYRLIRPQSPKPEDSPGLLERAFNSRAHAAAPVSPAPAQTSPDSRPAPATTRGSVVSPQEILGKVNTEGPQSWPSSDYLNTSLNPPAPPSPVSEPNPAAPSRISESVPAEQPPAPAERTPAQAAPQLPAPELIRKSALPPVPPPALPGGGNATRPVIYVDESGKEVPKPPEPEKMMEEAEQLMRAGQHSSALELLNKIKALPGLNPDLREKALYHIVEAMEFVYAGKPLEGYEPIVSAANEAMNANLRSARAPDALFRLGMANLRVGNLNEADAYFKALRRRYPNDINVPHAFAYLGRAFLEKDLYERAAEAFRVVTQHYPEAAALQEASLGLFKTFVKDKRWKEAEIISDFVDKRWPRAYLADLQVLEMQALLALGLGRQEEALQLYWLYYNLEPSRKGNDVVLAAIGDLYLLTNRVQPAMKVFAEILERYPDGPGAEIALLRMSEKGVHDSPVDISEMNAVFADPGVPPPPAAYREIIRRWPDSPRSVLARLKLAIWMLWDKQYTDAMGAAADFIDAYPDNPDVEQARVVIMRAFMAELQQALVEENYGRILILWNGFPLVRQRYGHMDPALRNALARGYLERGDESAAMELLSEFLKTPKTPGYSDQTFALYFNKYLRTGNWNALLDLGELVKDWDMDPATRNQLEYAMALSAENLGLAEKALTAWKRLAQDDGIPLYQKAYATYFMAKDAERRKSIKDAYAYYNNTLELFTRLEQERSDKADPERVKESMGRLMDITEVANRIPEALEWLERYDSFVPETSPEYPGLRFREARLYRKLGDMAKSKSLLELIVQKNPDSPFAKAAETELRTFNVSRDLRDFMPPAP